MDFFKCSIGGVKYGQGQTEIQRHLAGEEDLSEEAEEDVSPYREPGFNFMDTCAHYSFQSIKSGVTFHL
jgi:hypothetical protein